MLGAVGLQAPVGFGCARGMPRLAVGASRPGRGDHESSAAERCGRAGLGGKVGGRVEARSCFLELSSREGGGWEKCSRKKVALA